MLSQLIRSTRWMNVIPKSLLKISVERYFAIIAIHVSPFIAEAPREMFKNPRESVGLISPFLMSMF